VQAPSSGGYPTDQRGGRRGVLHPLGAVKLNPEGGTAYRSPRACGVVVARSARRRQGKAEVSERGFGVS